MGIRFLCPNGHKLNVKAFLVGKRGICPQCDAKFLVPKESGGQAEVIVEAVAASSGDASHHAHAEPPPAPNPPSEVGSPEVWYVRTAAGEQYGPANVEVMHSWVADGRVAVDCWVWRSGWPEWKTGGQALTFLNGPPPEVLPPLAPVAELPVEASSESPEASLPEPTSQTVAYRSSKRIRQERARKATFFLGAIVMLLFAVLIVVWINNK